MARKTSTVLLMMTGTLVIFVAVGGLGLMFVSDYDAVEYEYEVTGTHQVVYESGQMVPWILNGTVSTINMDVFGITRITMTSDIGYFDAIENTNKKYDFAGRWSFLSEPDLGTMIDSVTEYTTANYGDIHVDIYEVTEGNAIIKRWVGHDDGVIYRLERTITNGDLETHIIQELVSFKETKMPLKI